MYCGDKYKPLLNVAGVDLSELDFQSHEFIYDFKDIAKDFIKIEDGEVILIAGDADDGIVVNKALMKFLETEPITILNPKPNEDLSWSRLVISPASSKLKRLIFKSVNDETEYYQNGRIKKMYFEEKGIQ